MYTQSMDIEAVGIIASKDQALAYWSDPNNFTQYRDEVNAEFERLTHDF